MSFRSFTPPQALPKVYFGIYLPKVSGCAPILRLLFFLSGPPFLGEEALNQEEKTKMETAL
ncbi:MAG: hypothetical protein A2504_13005 [Bdellovibrionales bacterium RIFOXYD12_FULL_39_22]|nr:MAG: hypothetical protein A2385_00805 [Bdellovibrionales bacterium RIFOXYB1_FULL_39_21]OFZ43547.1 MAG: hypothetical protein A2485_12475 [Bdellovibrionales bacterium RIFOXYC12_FULL_39_17]OFZ44566.1 MAG: hypothetical protein A2404_10165 [Bdellovibrionales bacterium RIFOXYC1_FULL_39_130]OFZ71250.1 MAG: hypothetical protein A2451_11990 [Bdellovibrionales bacterium RIFOXYC2_FULL_39_8]OFZ76325.1 MAG: hypothetical protein A2560_06785 [Bdellovibrionales bacterium RIFOXYD1_FULL_39_84]OFZ94591.1 MAG: